MTAQHPSLYLFRHGESTLQKVPGLINGRQNEAPMTPLGQLQARMLGEWLLAAEVIPDKVYSSPALRARGTAGFALGAMGINPSIEISDDLQEMSQGDWTGRTRNEIYDASTQLQINRLQKDFGAPGGESMRQVGQRTRRWLGSVPTTGTTFAFTHGLATRCLVGDIEDMPHETIRTTQTPNTSITELRYINNAWEVEYMGAVPHLPPDYVTN